MLGGVLIGFALHLFQIVILAVVGIFYLMTPKELQDYVMLGFGSPMVIGLTQFLYIIPAYRKFSRGPNPQWAKGLLVSAAITFLLNASCLGLVFGTKWDFR